MEPKEYKLLIAEYSEYPGPRYCNQGSFSGEHFYHTALNESFGNAFLGDAILTIDLDGTAGYASSFLDEAFGSLIFDFSLAIVKDHLRIISKQEPDWKDLIENTIFSDWEERRRKNEPPKITQSHTEWFRVLNGNLEKGIWIHY
jgi:hypothetical protein